MLDADQALKESDQGRSFYAFWQFLLSSDRQQALRAMIQAVYELEELQPVTQKYGLLKRIEYSLLEAAQYIVRSNHRLSEKLRQMLDERALRENKRVAELIQSVKRLAAAANASSDSDLEKLDFWTLEGDPTAQLVIERPLHPLEDPEPPTFSLDFTDLPEDAEDTEAMSDLFQQFYVDEDILSERIDLTLDQRSTVSFAELIQLYPVVTTCTGIGCKATSLRLKTTLRKLA